MTVATKLTRTAVDKARAKDRPYELLGQHGLTLRVQPTGRKTYYVRYGRSGRRRIGRTDVITFERAEYLARALLNEAHDFGDPLKRDLRKSTLGGFIEAEYSPWLRANRRNPDKTLADLKRNFAKLYEKRLTDIGRRDFDRYVQESVAHGRTIATVVRSLNNLRRVLRLAIDRTYLRENAFIGWTRPKPDDRGITRYLSEDEERRLRSALIDRDDRMRQERIRANDWRRQRGHDMLPEWGERDYPDHLTPMVLLSLNTGLRYGELAGLDWSAIDLRARVLTVTGRTAKGAKSRQIPLNAEAVVVLERWREQGKRKGLLFTNGGGERIGTVKTAWIAVLEAAEIEGFRWHDLRHSFASKLVQRGVDLAVVRELLGHGDFALTLRYSHLQPGQKADAVARLAS
jgi:site-specific recombinase XerD